MRNFFKNKPRLFTIVVIISVAAAIFSYDPAWRIFSSKKQWLLGLDIAGGTSLTYDVDLSAVAGEDQGAVLGGLRDVIEKRVNLFGVSEPKVIIIKNDSGSRLIVELAGVKNVPEAIQMIGETPFLDFREVEPMLNSDGTPSKQTKFIPTELNGRYIKKASISLNSVTQKPAVSLEFTDNGSKIFANLTEKNIGKPIAIFLDNALIEAPVVQEKISGGRAEISGNFTPNTARKLVERFNAGALPAPINLVNQYTVNPELGSDSLNKAIIAGILGTLLIMIFMIIYYRELGIFASIALIMYISLTLAVFKIIPITMTLSGIAGFILSIGMAVDANILVFERTKEEIKKGVSKNRAIEEGFKRAWSSIRDSNISTMITALVLYYFTSSFIKGFALTLFLGVVMSMFSAITISKTMLDLFYKKNESH